MTTVIVDAAEAWPVVAAGLGSALIVALFTLWVARKQRDADSTRLGEQLAHDRTMREQELREAAERLDRQLAQDRDLREQQRQAESGRLDRQLAHDRDMRDLQYLRETLAPIAEHAIGWGAFTSLHFALKQAEGREFEEWRKAILAPMSEVGKTTEKLRRDGRVLVLLLGPEAEVPKWLGELANDGDALIHVVRERVEAKRTTPEIEAAIDGLWTKFGFDQARFIEHVNKAVRLDSA